MPKDMSLSRVCGCLNGFSVDFLSFLEEAANEVKSGKYRAAYLLSIAHHTD